MFIDTAMQNYVLDGRGYGPVGSVLNQVRGPYHDRIRYEPGMMRPYFDKHDRPSVTVNTGRWTMEKGERRPILEHRLIRDLMNQGFFSPVFNATTLRKEEWIEYDRTVLRAARYRLKAWSDLAGANSYGLNGMSKLILEHETMSDPGEAIVDMSGLTEGRGDTPIYQLEGLPLPITHSDFFLDSRTLAVSRNSGTPLDTTMGEAAGRRVGESIEKTLIGNQTGVIYGGNSTQVGGYGRTSQVYGYKTFPKRLTSVTGYKPTGTGRGTSWSPNDTLKDVLAALDALRLNKFFGPWMLYHSNDWDQYLDNDYQVFTVGGSNYGGAKTLRQRLMDIKGISGVERLDFLFASAPSATTGPGGENLTAGYPFNFIFVQMTPDVARAVNGLDITTVQWESKGGMQLNFKVMAIQVPQLRADFYGNCGILDLVCSLG